MFRGSTDLRQREAIGAQLMREEDAYGRRSEALQIVSDHIVDCREHIARIRSLKDNEALSNGHARPEFDLSLSNLERLLEIFGDFKRTLALRNGEPDSE